MKEFWNERYAGEDYIYGTSPNAWLAACLNRINKGKILFPAEGEGRNAVYAATLGWAPVAFDQSEAARKKAIRLAAVNGIALDYHVCDLNEYHSEKEQFDAIALIFVHMPPETRSKIHSKLLEYLKPGGALILEAFTKNQLRKQSGGPREESLLYDSNMLAGDFGQLEIIESGETTTILDEGNFHQGEACVIRLLARKPALKKTP